MQTFVVINAANHDLRLIRRIDEFVHIYLKALSRRARRIAAGGDPRAWHTFSDSSGMRESCVLLCNKLSIPARMNRCCHRCPVTLLPDSSSRGWVPSSPVGDKIRARHTCFCALFR